MFDINRLSILHGRRLGSIAGINETEIEKLIYALKRLYKFIVYIVATLVISSILNITTSVLYVFMTIFLLRIQFGGKHVENYWICLMVSVVIPMSLGVLSYYINFSLQTLLVIYIFAYMIAIFIGTVDNEKKRLTKERKHKHKVRGMITLTIIMLINFMMCIQNQSLIVNSIGLGVIASFSNVIIVKD